MVVFIFQPLNYISLLQATEIMYYTEKSVINVFFWLPNWTQLTLIYNVRLYRLRSILYVDINI